MTDFRSEYLIKTLSKVIDSKDELEQFLKISEDQLTTLQQSPIEKKVEAFENNEYEDLQEKLKKLQLERKAKQIVFEYFIDSKNELEILKS